MTIKIFVTAVTVIFLTISVAYLIWLAFEISIAQDEEREEIERIVRAERLAEQQTIKNRIFRLNIPG